MKKWAELVRIVGGLLILATLIYVGLSPQVTYAPVPRTVLFLLGFAFIAINFGGEATTRLKLTGRGFTAYVTGSFAFVLILLYTATYLSQPSTVIAAFQIVDENNQEVNLNWPEAIKLGIGDQSGLTASMCATGSKVFLVFPEQLAQQELRVRKSATGPEYVGDIVYTGQAQRRLKLGDQLKPL